jgi:uncharacterized protein (DUF1501 family)
MGTGWRNTVVANEFGRRFLQHGNRRTEHGHGSVMCVLGGAVHGGRLVSNCRYRRQLFFRIAITQ